MPSMRGISTSSTITSGHCASCAPSRAADRRRHADHLDARICVEQRVSTCRTTAESSTIMTLIAFMRRPAAEAARPGAPRRRRCSHRTGCTDTRRRTGSPKRSRSRAPPAAGVPLSPFDVPISSRRWTGPGTCCRRRRSFLAFLRRHVRAAQFAQHQPHRILAITRIPLRITPARDSGRSTRQQKM